jgi:hypothetical protein
MTGFLDQERLLHLRSKEVVGKERLPAWPRDDKELDVVYLEVEWLRFSVLNHRTRAQQEKKERDSGSGGLFRTDPLGSAAQEAQAELLREGPGYGSLKADLQERGQQESVVVTAEGVLINGNRRVAALRDLWDEGVPGARLVRCVVLPADASREDSRLLETELQVAERFEEDYTWINRLLLVDELMTGYGHNRTRVASIMHTDEADIDASMAKLNLVRELIAISNGRYLPVDFEPHESAFTELANHIKGKPAEDVRGAQLGYFLGIVGDNRYRDLRHLRIRNAADYLEAEIPDNPLVATLLANSESSAGQAETDDEVDELLAGALGETGDRSNVERLLVLAASIDPEATVDLPGNGYVGGDEVIEQVNQLVEAACLEAKSDHEDREREKAPTKRLREAVDKIRRAQGLVDEARELPGWDEPGFQEALEELEEAVSVLRAEQ